MPPPFPAVALSAVLVTAALAGCGGDGDGDGAAPTTRSSPSVTAEPVTSSTGTPTTSSTTLPVGGTEAPDCGVPGSSPARFDSAGGRYTAYLTDIDVARRMIAFDVVQFLTGDDAAEAYRRDFPNEPDGPDNDYYIVNESRQVRDAPVSDDVAVRLVELDEDADADVDPAAFEDLPGYLARMPSEDERYLSSALLWLTFDDGTVTEICEQYRP